MVIKSSADKGSIGTKQETTTTPRRQQAILVDMAGTPLVKAG
jgi:hypothetical protein